MKIDFHPFSVRCKSGNFSYAQYVLFSIIQNLSINSYDVTNRIKFCLSWKIREFQVNCILKAHQNLILEVWVANNIPPL